MTDITELTQEAARESGSILIIVAARMARREFFTPLHALCESGKRVVSTRALCDAVERAEEHMVSQVPKIVDGHDRLTKKLKEAESRNAELVEALEKAQSDITKERELRVAAENRACEMSVAELVSELETAQQVDDELCKLLPPGVEYMDPPDGGDVTPLEGVRRMVADYRQRIAELEAQVKFPGVMRCNTCGFSRSHVIVTPGWMLAGESEPERCPNGCGPLWHDTYRRQYNELYDAYKELESRTVTDWIEHDGKWRPESLGLDELVYLKTRKQELKIPYPVGKVKGWMNTGGDMDVMAYKLASPQSSTVTVKLPATIWYEHDDYAQEIAVLEKSRVLQALTAAGIKWEAE